MWYLVSQDVQPHGVPFEWMRILARDTIGESSFSFSSHGTRCARTGTETRYEKHTAGPATTHTTTDQRAPTETRRLQHFTAPLTPLVSSVEPSRRLLREFEAKLPALSADLAAGTAGTGAQAALTSSWSPHITLTS
jgi:hypothetical protein